MALPFLDITAPGFSTRGPEVLAARAESWCARTPFGLAVLRHNQAGRLLRDRRLRQGSHAWPATVGLTGAFADFWRRSIISEEGERHRHLRRVARDALSDAFVLTLKPAFREIAERLVEDLRPDPAFAFIDRFSEPFAGRAIARLLGEPDEAAADIATDASTLGLAMGLAARRHEAAANAATERLRDLADRLLGEARPDTFAGRLGKAAETHGLSDHQALVDLVVISIFGGVDTTRAQLAFAMILFAEHPDQWTWLRDNPAAIPEAIEEVIRTRPTTTWATREALEDFELDGVKVAAGDILHVFVHATGTDPVIGVQDGFDIRAARKTHFGFGGGAHHCLGQFVARTDMGAALDVLCRNWSRVSLAAEPVCLADSGNTSPTRLDIAPVWQAA